MTLYSTTDLPIRDDLHEAHDAAWRELAEPGTWWSGSERIAIAATARNARLRAGVAEGAPAPIGAALPDAAKELATALGAAPGTMERSFYDERVPGRLEEGPWVEAVAVVARSVCVDTFCRGAGLPLHPYLEAALGAPTRETPSGLTRDECAWVSTIAPGTPEGDALYGGPTVNVVRALSRVPAEIGAWMRVAGTQYVHVSVIEDLAEPAGRALDRTQIELVAGRVSAVNECFY